MIPLAYRGWCCAGVGRAGERLLELVHDVVMSCLAAAGASARAVPEGHQDQRGEDEPCTPGTDRAALRASACRHHWFGRAAPAGETPSVSKAPSGPPDPGDKRQDAKRGDQTAIGEPEHQEKPNDSSNRGVFVLDRQLNFLSPSCSPVTRVGDGAWRMASLRKAPGTLRRSARNARNRIVWRFWPLSPR
jgi:hypothetical protein